MNRSVGERARAFRRDIGEEGYVLRSHKRPQLRQHPRILESVGLHNRESRCKHGASDARHTVWGVVGMIVYEGVMVHVQIAAGGVE